MDHPSMRVSDDEREETVELLRGHMLAGRLESDELEERIGAACRAKTFADLDFALRELPPLREPAPAPAPAAPVFVQAPPSGGAASTAMSLAIFALVLFVVTFGFASLLTLPLASAACLVARDAMRSGDRSGKARAGYVLGLVGVGLSVLWFGGCAVLVG